MQYVKGTPYFCKKFKKIKEYPYLNNDISTDILIVGGGVCGAILNYYLSQKFDVVLIDKGRIGQCCTSCATAILEYQLDDFYSKLKKEFSKEEIIEIYKMGINSVNKIEKFIKKHGNECDFYKRPSFLYTTKESEYKLLKNEYELRKNHGLKCEFIDKNNNPFNFEVAYGIYAPNGGAELNPYLFTKQLIENAENQDKIFENTGYESMIQKEDYIEVRTNYNQIITCKRIVFATGFNLEEFDNQDIIERFTTYTIVTNKLKDFEWFNRATIHDTVDPYHYLRLLPNNRIIFGGEDVPFKKSNMEEKKAMSKYKKLYNFLLKMFPMLKDKIEVEYSFCGCFGATDNNLGLIGETDTDNVYYFLSCGTNGIVNAMYGVELMENLLNNKQDKFEHLFTPLRVINK